MVRKDGYLNLDLYYKELGNTKGLIYGTEDSLSQYWLTIEGEKYYFKESDHPINEVICYELAKIMNIPSVPYDLAIFKDNYGVISKSYRKENCQYIPGYEILKKFFKDKFDILLEMGFDEEGAKRNKFGGAKYPYDVQMNNLETIWESLSYYFPGKDISKCMNKLVEQFIFSILTCQTDMAAHNWEIEISENGINAVDNYDNEESFNRFATYSEIDVSMHKGKSNFKDVLKKFLRISSSEYIDLFLEKYSLLTEENLLKVFEIIEMDYNIEISNSKKQRILENVKLNKIDIDDALEQCGIDKSIGRK